jgi:ubiquinone/menaquinone biosynthesis C-methylase UbiE
VTTHPIFARTYARVAPAMDHGGLVDYRRRLLTGLTGRVIEIGAGTGLNFAHYPPQVTEVLAIEPEPYLFRLAEVAARQAPVRVRVAGGFAEQLPAEDAIFDAAVVALVLCSVEDQAKALGEARRVLKTRGEFRFLEHVRAGTPILRRVQQTLDASVWPLLCGGCHTSRDTVAAITRAGFTIHLLDRFLFPDRGIPLPAATHVLGLALSG